jgi:dTDP-4-amino-4,6-dideoxygalactose transaminase
MDEFRAAVGLVQLKSLRRWNETRASLARQYRQRLAERCPAVLIPFAKKSSPAAHHFLPAVLPSGVNRKAVMGRMRDQGVQTTVHYPPIHCLSFYQSRIGREHLPNTEEFARRELTLPLHPRLGEGDVERVVAALMAALSQDQGDLSCQ